MRNVLKEFLERRHGQRKPTILGLREHIFTGRLVMSLIINWILMSVNGNDEGHSAEKHCRFFFFFPHVCLSFTLVFYSVSSLAWFMSNQETSFVTIGQRILANPLR
jgi:callose synthase